MTPSDIPIHPAAAMFPELQGDEFQALVEDIKKHGQREPIVIHDHMILDGRNRYRAVMSLFLKPKFVDWDGVGTPEAYVISKNIMRRHLTQSQRAMILSKFTTRPVGDQREAISKKSRLVELTVKEAADIGGFASSVMLDANVVRKRGTPDEIQKVETGEVHVRHAANNIRARHTAKPPPKREKKNKKPNTKTDANLGRIQRLKMRGNIWGDLKSGLIHFAALPDPKEVVKVARAMDRQKIIDTKLSLTIEWLEEFRNEWNRNANA